MKETLIILFSAFGVFLLYSLVAFIYHAFEHGNMKRKQKTIDSRLAFEKVRGGEGFFIISISGNYRELRYAPGKLVKDTGLLLNVYRSESQLVQHYDGKISLGELARMGVEGKCIEINIDGLVV